MGNVQEIVWTAKNRCRVGDVNFFATVDESEYLAATSNEAEFLIVKNREMIEAELEWTAQRDVRNIVDLGIWQGGSVALLDCIFQPEKLVAIEYTTGDLPPLEAYIRERERGDQIRLHMGVDQADTERLGAILDSEFGTKGIDLAIDDRLAPVCQIQVVL